MPSSSWYISLHGETPTLDVIKLQEDEGDSMSYDARKLITFEVFRASTGTIWVKATAAECCSDETEESSLL